MAIMMLSPSQKRRFLCRTTTMGDIDSSGHVSARGLGCLSCQGCEAPLGDMGLTAAGIPMVGTLSGPQLNWACPECGCTCSEDTSVLDAERLADEIAADPRCHRCRRAPASA
ncbi:MAG: hypothetical protein C0522_13820 [Rhodocyclaceae bacterium]|nr:hypothetical protein [Rhodocyclaceae bacterium]